MPDRAHLLRFFNCRIANHFFVEYEQTDTHGLVREYDMMCATCGEHQGTVTGP